MKKEIVKPGNGWEEPETGDKVRGACAAAWGWEGSPYLLLLYRVREGEGEGTSAQHLCQGDGSAPAAAAASSLTCVAADCSLVCGLPSAAELLAGTAAAAAAAAALPPAPRAAAELRLCCANTHILCPLLQCTMWAPWRMAPSLTRAATATSRLSSRWARARSSRVRGSSLKAGLASCVQLLERGNGGPGPGHQG